MTRRAEFLQTVSRVVVKVGSQVVAPSGALDENALDHLCRGILNLRSTGLEVVLVSSGAIAAGARALGLAERPRSIPLKQASAAAGQPVILNSYARRLTPAGLQVAQILLTADDIRDRTRFINARNTFASLLGVGALPVVNENDTVAIDEIKLGDNDRLSALVANLVEAQLLILLTDVDGFYDSEPGSAGGRRYDYIEEVTSEHRDQAGPSRSGLGLGGMVTKLEAARQATRAGTATVIAAGTREGVLESILGGEVVGTWFAASEGMSARKHWIAYLSEPRGAVTIDAGAVGALCERGKSLLPSGVLDVEGAFERGESVRVLDENGVEVGRGLAGYSAADLRRIRGGQSADIEEVLGYRYFDEAIHRDNLVLS
jgi:glutamate 5-kinase